MNKKKIYIDFEFNKITHQFVDLVCAATREDGSSEVRKWWLYLDTKNKKSLVDYLKTGSEFVAYSAIAECRSMHSLENSTKERINPLDFQWTDLFLEYRALSNHNDNYNWGHQLVDGKVVFTSKPKPKWERTEEDEKGFKPTHSLAEATYKLTGQIRDTDHKTKMRDLIISAPNIFSPKEMEDIMEYCAEDVRFLEEIETSIINGFKKELGSASFKIDEYKKEAWNRGRYAAHTAVMETNGYPISYEKTKAFSNSVPSIMYETQEEINKFFPDIKPFRWNKAEQRFSWDQKKTREWISKKYDKSEWKLTDGGKSGIKDYSLSLEAFEQHFDFDHYYPEDNFGAQMVRFLKLKQNLYGFVPTSEKKKKNFWDFVGPDHRVRPYYNIYGAQSSRSQPASTGFMFLKPAWMRALVEPSPGMLMGGIDYGSEEFFLSALLSKDQNMIDAYLSGDVYLAFGKQCGMIPPDGTKEKYKFERNVCKATVLGISYLMSKYGLAKKLTADTGKVWDEDQAEDLINAFYASYPDLQDYQRNIIEEYSGSGVIKLPCGWPMWGDNPNDRSVTNMPVQGLGASIMRKAVDLAVAKGLYVPITLHDALYIEFEDKKYPKNKHPMTLLANAMREAFIFYIHPSLKNTAKEIRLDPFIWGPSKPAPTFNEKGEPVFSEENIDGEYISVSNLYIDERAVVEYNKFSKYFEPNAEQEL
jgi:hypothetical protein